MHDLLLVASNYGSASASTSKPVQIIKLVKPAAGQTENYYASVDGLVKVDLTAIANEQVIYFRDSNNHSLHVIFTNDSQAIIAPFFDLTGVMSNLVLEMAPDQVLDSAEFTSQFPVTTNQNVLPALTEGSLDSGAEFNDPSVDHLPPVNLALASPEGLLPLAFHDLPPIFAAGSPPAPLPPPTLPSPPESNNNPFITAAVDHATVTEGPLPVMTAHGTIDFGDVDLADVHVTSVTPGGSGYLGNFSAIVNNDSTGDGVGQVIWLFAANNELRQFLGANQELVQTYTVDIDDGHGGTATQLVTITINGTNDAAVISGATTGTVVEAGGVNNATPGTPTATGDLNSTDVDNPADSWQAVPAGAATATAPTR